MKTTIDISIDTAKLALVVSSLEDEDLGLLLRALVASACGEDASPFLNTSGVIIACLALPPLITCSASTPCTPTAPRADARASSPLNPLKKPKKTKPKP